LGAEQLAQFKRAHLAEISKYLVDGVIDFNADSFLCVVSVTCASGKGRLANKWVTR
jgi:hypothetical protein